MTMPYITDNEGNQWEYRETSKFGGMNEVNRLAQDGWMFCRTRSLPERLCDGSYYNHTIYIMKRFVQKSAEKTETTEQVRAEYNHLTGTYNEKIEPTPKKCKHYHKPIVNCLFCKDYVNGTTEPVQETPENGQVSGDMPKQGTPEKGTPQNPCTCNHPACMMYHNESVDKDSLIEQLEKIQGYTSKYPNNLSLADHRAYIEGVIKPIDQIIKRLKND